MVTCYKPIKISCLQTIKLFKFSLYFTTIYTIILLYNTIYYLSQSKTRFYLKRTNPKEKCITFRCRCLGYSIPLYLLTINYKRGLTVRIRKITEK